MLENYSLDNQLGRLHETMLPSLNITPRQAGEHKYEELQGLYLRKLINHNASKLSTQSLFPLYSSSVLLTQT